MFLDSDDMISKYALEVLFKDINENDAEVLFAIRPSNLTVEEALNAFYTNRKLQAIIITRTGINLERPLGILTIADIIDLNKVVEDYDV